MNYDEELHAAWGDAMQAMTHLEGHPASMDAADTMDKFAKFVEEVAGLPIWDYDDYQERDYPAEGYLESHYCLMELVEIARKLIPYRSKE